MNENQFYDPSNHPGGLYEDPNTAGMPKKSKFPVVAGAVVLVLTALVLTIMLKTAHSDLTVCKTAAKRTQESLDAVKKSSAIAAVNAQTDREECQTTQQAMENKISSLESSLKNNQGKINELRDANAQAKRELSQFKAFSAKFTRMVNAGKLEVVFRRGRMVVNLPAKVLFDSGSADLSDDGKKALKEVAKILRTVRDKRFVVAGHTDNQRIKRAKFKSNWELSTARALAVTEVLVKGGVKPQNLAAAGFSQYAPIAKNSTEGGRQTNRRIEIILEPNLKSIKPLVNKTKKAKAKKAKGKK